MKVEEKLIFTGTVIILLFGIVSSTVLRISASTAAATEEGGDFACTMEAKLCPDGTYVGRVAPYCQFAPCADSTLR